MPHHFLPPALFIFAVALALPCRAEPVSPPAPKPVVTLDLGNRAQFPPELLPGLGRAVPDDVFLTGLATLYPGRILRVPPAAPVAPVVAREAVFAKLPGGVEYVRCYPNGAKDVRLPVLESENRLVDLRYFASGPESVAACAALCEKLTGVAPDVRAQGKYPAEETPPAVAPATPALAPTAAPAPTPSAKTVAAPRVVVLVNKGTSGPVEAMLADLQMRGRVLLVGSATAGNTASYVALEKNPGWWRIAGELQSGGKADSLVAVGVQPSSQVKHAALTPDAALLAWQHIERGVAPEQLLTLPHQQTAATKSRVTATTATTGGDPELDLVLRRGYDILVALQVMGIAPPFPQRELNQPH